MTEQTRSPPRTVVYRATERRTFKACRTCRQQKARCIGAEDPPCKRCRSTGRDCVFEELAVGSSRKRPQPASSEDESGNKRSSGGRIQELEIEISQLRSLVNDIRATPIPESFHQRRISASRPAPSHQGTENSPSAIESQSNRPMQPSILVENSTSPADLTLLHLDAPITAVQAMSMNGMPPSPSSVQSQDSSPACISASGRGDRHGTAQTVHPKPNDVVSAGLITEFEARKLFQLYMANANVFLPVFDPAVDTFDAVRQSSTFCFTVILAIALRAEHPSSSSSGKGDRCFLEAQNLATQSLFASFARLETVQGMLLLSAYSDKNWYAVSHAYQMSRDMGLPDIIHHEDVSKYTELLQNSSDRRLVRRTRTALILHHVEQEVASGTTRPSKSHPVEGGFLRKFLENKFFNASDMRIVANVEIVQLRGRLLRELEVEQSHVGTVHQWVQNIEQEINEWFNHWDAVFQGQDIGVGCFQRSSIRLQRDYAFIILCSVIISKMSSELSSEPTGETMAEEMRQIVDETFERSVKILNFIAENNDYKWYLQWAPTYSALFPAFTAALAFRLAKIRPSVTDWRALQSSFIKVADILKDYPYQHFALIIQDLSKLCQELSRSEATKNSQESRRTREATQSRTQYHNVDLGTDSPATVSQNRMQPSETSPAFSNTENIPSNNFFDTETDRTCWIPGSESDFPPPDNTLAPEQMDMQSLLTMPDYIFDFNLFATSMQSSTDDPYFSGRM